MTNKKHKKVIHLLSLLLVVVFTCQLYSKAFYQHSHRLPDGSIVTHAHPFDKNEDRSPFKEHHHSSYELFVIENSKLLFTLSAISLLIVCAGRKENIIPITILERVIIYLSVSSGRSPPLA